MMIVDNNQINDNGLATARSLMVLVAHPDDECLGAGGLLQTTSGPHIVFCTSGDLIAWSPSYHSLAQVRENEAAHALSALGIADYTFLRYTDQQLHHSMNNLFREVVALAERLGTDCILTHAFEAGHPDHDSCAVIASQLEIQLGIEVWEMPLYHLSQSGAWILQQFKDAGSPAWHLPLSEDQRSKKREALACYQSQAQVVSLCRLDEEVFRKQIDYEFARTSQNHVENFAVSDVRVRSFCQRAHDFLCSVNPR